MYDLVVSFCDRALPRAPCPVPSREVPGCSLLVAAESQRRDLLGRSTSELFPVDRYEFIVVAGKVPDNCPDIERSAPFRAPTFRTRRRLERLAAGADASAAPPPDVSIVTQHVVFALLRQQQGLALLEAQVYERSLPHTVSRGSL